VNAGVQPRNLNTIQFERLMAKKRIRVMIVEDSEATAYLTQQRRPFLIAEKKSIGIFVSRKMARKLWTVYFAEAVTPKPLSRSSSCWTGTCPRSVGRKFSGFSKATKT
jgi:hypothetical protein